MDLPIILSLAGIGILGILCQWLAWWVKLPSILFLLLLGLFLGPVTGWLNPDELLGDLLFPIVSLSVAVILFEGSLTLRIREIKGLTSVVRNLLTIGVLLTWLLITLATHWVIGLSWELAFVFGALVVVTGPTVIIPLLRTVRPQPALANILRWEGIMIDPVGAVLAVLVFDFMISDQSSAFSSVLSIFVGIIIVGLVIGLLAAEVLGLILRHQLLPGYLQNVFVLTMVVTVYALADTATPESGLLAVTIMGIRMANMQGIDIERIIDFKESLSVLLISAAFIILAARLEVAQFQALGWHVIVLLLIIMLIIRPIAVFASSIGCGLSLQEKTLLSWISPRGIVAAAVSALFALRLEAAGYPDAYLLVPLTFTVIIGTVLIQSLTARPLANALGVSEEAPRGLLLVAGNTVSLSLGKALNDRGFPVLLADSSWENISSARMSGLQTFYGNAISDYADRHMELLGFGKMLALSPRSDFNALACQRFAYEFGKRNVFELSSASINESAEKHTVSAKHGGHKLFGQDATYAKLASLLSQGAEIKSTQLSENFTFSDYKNEYGSRLLVLFGIDEQEKLHVFINDDESNVGSEWQILGLISPEEPIENVKSS